jgi:histidine triad (HIT) family protein
MTPQRPAVSCVFCSIVAGKTSAEIVFEDENILAILDHRPLIPGHCLVLTRIHYETLLDVPAASLGPCIEVVQKLGRAFERGLGADGSFTAINTRVSQSVPHVHIHVVPRRNKDGLFARGIVWKRQPYPDEATMRAMGERIRRELTPA